MKNNSANSLFFPLLFITTISLIAVSGLVAFAVNAVDSSARDNLKEQVEVSLAVEADRLSELLVEYSYWDDAYQNLIVEPDSEWADGTIGSYLADDLGIALSLAVNESGQVTLGYLDGELNDFAMQELLAAGLKSLRDESQQAEGREPAPQSGFITLQGERYLVALDYFVPEEIGAEPHPAAGYLVMAKRIDSDLIAEIAELYRLPALQLSFGAPADNVPSLHLNDPQQNLVASLSWLPPAPAKQMLLTLLPYLVLFVALSLLAMWWVLRVETQRRLAYEQELHFHATTDPLTGLNNRRQFYHLAETEIKRCQRYDEPLSVLLLDVDYFKRINDQYGHNGGDEALIELCKRVQDNLRDVDIFGRFGGEEFAIILPTANTEQAAEAAERLRESLANEPFTITGLQVPVTASFGITLSRDDKSLDDLFKEADIALYEAKRNGRNCVVVWGETS